MKFKRLDKWRHHGCHFTEHSLDRLPSFWEDLTPYVPDSTGFIVCVPRRWLQDGLQAAVARHGVII